MVFGLRPEKAVLHSYNRIGADTMNIIALYVYFIKTRSRVRHGALNVSIAVSPRVQSIFSNASAYTH